LRNPAGQGVSIGHWVGVKVTVGAWAVGVNEAVGVAVRVPALGVGVMVAQLPEARQTARSTKLQSVGHSPLAEANEQEGEVLSH